MWGGDLTLAVLGEQLVAGCRFIDGQGASIYAIGVSDGTQFDKPLGHYPVWLRIEHAHAHARDVKLLELGNLKRGAANEKDYQIGYLKRGFATHTETLHVWHWSHAS
jgi:hypothetical protein